MKYKIIVISIMLMILSFPLSAQITQKIAILNFEPEERASRTTASQIMHSRRGDFVNLFNDYEQYELISQNVVDKTLSDNGITSVRNLTSQMAAKIGEKINADILIWGSISEASATEVRILANVMNVRSQSINQLRFNSRKRSADRRETIREEIIEKIDSLIGGEVTRLYNIAEQHVNAENYDRALEILLRIVEIDPNHLEAWFYLGYLAFMIEDYDASIEYCLAGLELTPNNERIMNNLAQAQIQAGRYDCAIETLEQLTEINTDETTWKRLANVYFDINADFDAIETLQEGLKFNPESERIHYRLGVALFGNNEFHESIPHLEFIAERNPEDDFINRKLTAAYMRTDQLDQAIRNYRNQIERDPTNVTAYLNLAGALRTQEKNEEALQVLNQLASFDDNNPTVFIRLADIHIALNNLDQAAQYANQAKNIDDTLYEPYTLLAQVSQMKGYEAYESFIEYEEKAQEAFGSEADRLIDLRNTARNNANNLFREADQLLQDATDKTTLSAIINDINARRQLLQQLIHETRRTFFD